MDNDSHPLDFYPDEETGDERADSLMLIDKARAALAQAETLSDIGAVREIAERARRYASAAKLGKEAENHAARLRIDAERKAGALLLETPKNQGGRPTENLSDVPTGFQSPPKLPELGISRQQASDWQRIAKIPETVYRAHVERVAKTRKPLTTESVVQVARTIEKQERRSEPKPAVEATTLPARIEVADARNLPLNDEVVDLIVTSPPYGLDIAYEGGDVSAEAWPAFMVAWLAEALRVTKPSGRLALNIPLDTTVGGSRPTYAQAVMAAMGAGWSYKATIVWHENNTTKGNRSLGSVNSSARPHPVDASEMIVLLSKGAWGPSSENPDNIDPDEWQEFGRGPWTFSGESRAWEDHPAPFPERLPYLLIRHLCRVGDVVLDPFVGSGTTVAVAYDWGRQAIGFDASATYVESARRRLASRIERARAS
jgi:site-specific DNA-methyltransferase (adenine-specific)